MSEPQIPTAFILSRTSVSALSRGAGSARISIFLIPVKTTDFTDYCRDL
jgi:hypothetical protein